MTVDILFWIIFRCVRNLGTRKSPPKQLKDQQTTIKTLIFSKQTLRKGAFFFVKNSKKAYFSFQKLVFEFF